MTMSPAPRSSFAFVPHVGEVTLQLRGATVAEILEQAALGLAQVSRGGRLPAGQELTHEIGLDAPDREALLVDWLNELLFLAERHRWLPSRIEIHEATDTHLRATAHGPVLSQAPSLVKAATWHGLRFDLHDDGYQAEVLLDV